MFNIFERFATQKELERKQVLDNLRGQSSRGKGQGDNTKNVPVSQQQINVLLEKKKEEEKKKTKELFEIKKQIKNLESTNKIPNPMETTRAQVQLKTNVPKIRKIKKETFAVSTPYPGLPTVLTKKTNFNGSVVPTAIVKEKATPQQQMAIDAWLASYNKKSVNKK